MPSKENPTDPENKNPFLEELKNEFPLKFKTFKDFWEKIDKKNKVAVFMSIEELKQWSKTVFKASRQRKLKI